MVPVQDADSATADGRKAEGAFYVWTADEVDEVLGTDSERARLFRRHYYVKPQGNADLSPRRCLTAPVLCVMCEYPALHRLPCMMGACPMPAYPGRHDPQGNPVLSNRA